MKTLVLAFAVAVAAATVAQAAEEEWVVNFRRCEIGKTFYKGEYIAQGGEQVDVTITPADIPAIEKGLKVLKQCEKFWTCVNKRYEGKVKHCYLPRSRR
jgi:hypothetical protein